MSVRDGRSKTTLYKVWKGIKARCTYPTGQRYKNYGGRGIYVADEWMTFDNFRQWATEAGYLEGLQIDRVDNDGPYSPENCRWVTPKENARKKSTSKMLTYKGKTQCVSAWAEELGINQRTLHARVYNYGWTDEEALEGRRLC